MRNIHLKTSIALAAFALAACSSGSSTTTPDPTTLEVLNIGTTNSERDFGANGQPFADTVSVDGAPPPPGAGFDGFGEVLLVIVRNGTEETVTIDLASATYRVDRGDNPDGGLDGALIIEIDGEELEFGFPDNQPSAFLVAEGTDGTRYELRSLTADVFSSTVAITTGSHGTTSPFALYTFGFETRPDQLPTSGTANYAGDLRGAAFLNGATSEINGDIRFGVNFDSSRINGSVTASAFGETVDFVIAATDIVGNGFSTTASVICPIPDACTSGTQIGGAFFGPTGQEISGVAVINESFTAGGTTSTLTGAAGYTATRN